MLRLDALAEEERQDRRQSLLDLLDSLAWKEVALPAIRRRMAGIEKQLATNNSLSIEQVREKQGEWRILRMLAEDHQRFFRESDDG